MRETRLFSFYHLFRDVIIRNGCHFAVWPIDIGQTAKFHPFHTTTILNTKTKTVHKKIQHHYYTS